MTNRSTIRLIVFSLGLVFAAGGSPSSQSPRQVLSPWLDTALRQGRADERHLVWVYLRDKGPVPPRVLAPSSTVTARARVRRARRATGSSTMATEDLPLDERYLKEISARVGRIRQQTRWLNAVSVEATALEVQALSELPFVKRLDAVRRYRRARAEPFRLAGRARSTPSDHVASPPRGVQLDYGESFDQVSQMGVPELHQRGLTGEGVVVAVFDSGFPNLEHEAFIHLKILAERDFVGGIDSVRRSSSSHGAATLSALGGFREGELIGPAYGASFILAVTEDVRTETPVEEDHWAAAVEWAEAMGADVISSSLGYADFDLPFTSYTDRDMDGTTAITTMAADMAAARGIVVVNSAGNGGYHPMTNTLVAPADGKRVLAVGAVDRAGVRAEFSSVGPTADGRFKPDVAALGVDAKVVWLTRSGEYGFASGTSFSCPLTAGVVALLLQAHPTYTVEDVFLALRSTASQSDAPDRSLGWGIVNAVAAVDAEVALVAEPLKRFGFTITQ